MRPRRGWRLTALCLLILTVARIVRELSRVALARRVTTTDKVRLTRLTTTRVDLPETKLHVTILRRLRLRHRFLLGFLFGSVNTVKRDGLQERIVTKQSTSPLLPSLRLTATQYAPQGCIKRTGLLGSSLHSACRRFRCARCSRNVFCRHIPTIRRGFSFIWRSRCRFSRCLSKARQSTD